MNTKGMQRHIQDAITQEHIHRSRLLNEPHLGHTKEVRQLELKGNGLLHLGAPELSCTGSRKQKANTEVPSYQGAATTTPRCLFHVMSVRRSSHCYAGCATPNVSNPPYGDAVTPLLSYPFANCCFGLGKQAHASLSGGPIIAVPTHPSSPAPSMPRSQASWSAGRRAVRSTTCRS